MSEHSPGEAPEHLLAQVLLHTLVYLHQWVAGAGMMPVYLVLVFWTQSLLRVADLSADCLIRRFMLLFYGAVALYYLTTSEEVLRNVGAQSMFALNLMSLALIALIEDTLARVKSTMYAQGLERIEIGATLKCALQVMLMAGVYGMQKEVITFGTVGIFWWTTRCVVLLTMIHHGPEGHLASIWKRDWTVDRIDDSPTVTTILIRRLYDPSGVDPLIPRWLYAERHVKVLCTVKGRVLRAGVEW